MLADDKSESPEYVDRKSAHHIVDVDEVILSNKATAVIARKAA